MFRKPIIIISLTVAVVIVLLLLFFSYNRDGWKKDPAGQWQRVGNPTTELPKVIIEDCLKNSANISAGLVVGDCQKKLCSAENLACKSQVTEIFNRLLHK